MTANVEVNCSDDELERFLERAISLQRYETVDDESTTTDYGPVSMEYMHV